MAREAGYERFEARKLGYRIGRSSFPETSNGTGVSNTVIGQGSFLSSVDGAYNTGAVRRELWRKQ